MKRLIIIGIVFLTGISTMSGKNRIDFVVTNDGIFYFKNVRHSLNNFLIGIDNNGNLTRFSESEIIVYTKNGKQFEKLPYYDFNNNYIDDIFLELVKMKNDYRVYKHGLTNEQGIEITRYLVYKNRKFIKEISEKMVLLDKF